MNFRTITTAILFLVAVSAFGQRYEKMLRTRTVSNHTIVGAEFHSSSNSVFILTNVTNSNGDGLLIKVNASNGDTIWSKYVASSSQPESYKGLYVSGSNLYAYGYRQHANLEFPFLVKLTPDGDTVWTRHYRTIPWTTSSSCANSPGVVNGLVELATGELVLVGRNNNCDRAFLLKTTSAGVISSVKEYDSWVTGQYSPIQEFFDVREHLGNLFVLYRSSGPNATNQNVQYKGIFKLNNAGDTIRHYHLSINHQNSDVFDLQLDQNSNMFVAGRQYLGQNNYGFIEKLNSTGVSQWVYSPGAATIQWSAISDLQVDASGNVLGSGYFQKSGQSVDQFVVKVLANGTESWLKQYGYGDNGWGRELVQVGNNYALISNESFCWSSYKYGFRYNNSPPCTDHVVIQMMNSSGELGRFYAPPQQSEKQGRLKFFKTVSFNFETQEWTNVSIIPVSLTSPTGATSLYNIQNSNTNFAFQNSSWNNNGEGTFYFQASDKNGDVRFSDTLEVMPNPSFSVFDQFGNNSLVACAGDSLQLSVNNINAGSTYKWFYEGANGTSAAIRIATGASKYVKLSGYYKLREILASGDSATTSSTVLSIQTQKVKITSSSYPQTFYVSGSASDSLSSANPPILNWTQNRNLQHWIAPFGRYREYNVQQYYYTAADLSSRGLKANSIIDEVAFVLNQSYSSGSSLEDFKISAKWTANTVNSWITMTGSDVVLDSYWQSPTASAGRKSFNISDLTWDGTKSLVIQVSYRVNSFNSASDVNPIFKLEESSINVSRLIQSSTAITLLTNPGTSGVKSLKFRPLTEFKISLPAKNDTIVGCSSSIPLTVTNTGYQSLTWDNNSTSSSRTVTSAGLRWVQMIDANFCLSNDTVQVIFSPNTNSITASNDTAVVGSSVTLSAASAYLNLWSNGSTGNSINASNTGTYSLTSINADGCSVKDSVKVYILDLPQIRIGRPARYTGEVITGYTYMGKIGDRHVYLANNCGSISSAQSAISNLKGEFWYPRTAAENSEINSIYKSKEGCCGEMWLPVSRSSVGQPWTYSNGSAASYTNWDVNYNVNGLYAFINFGWNGFWNATTSATDCRKYFVSFSDNSTVAGANESVCDSAFLWTKAGFDSYEWRKDGTVISGTTNSILSSSSGIYTVKGIRATTSYNGLSSVNLSINPSPLVSITNLSGTVDLTGSNSIKLKAVYPSGSSVQWFINGVAQSAGQDSVVSNTVGWHRLVVTFNGCTSKDSVRLFQPIFVATNGNNSTGTGTLSSPFKTIQHAINQSLSGGKIYVLPGVYAEKLLIDRSIYLMSNFDRLGDTNAVHTTIIEPGSVGQITSSSNPNVIGYGGVNVISQGQNPILVSGFTIRNYITNYSSSWDRSAMFNVHYSNNVLVQNVVFKGALQGSGSCCNAAVVFDIQYSNNLRFNGVRILSNGNTSHWQRLAFVRESSVSFASSRFVNNALFQEGFNLNKSSLTLTNCLIQGNDFSNNGMFSINDNGGKLIFNHVTATLNSTASIKRLVSIAGTNNSVGIINSVISNASTGYITNSGTGNSVSARNSVLESGTITGTLTGVSIDIDPSNQFSPSKLQGFNLTNSSPAIGLARTPVLLFNESFVSPSLDLFGVARPSPSGSNPDAGALESSLAVGLFDASIVNCGFELAAQVLNSSNYLIEWNGPNNFLAFTPKIKAPTIGNYTLKVFSLDRNDTIVKSFNLTNPLDFDIITVKDVCTRVSSTSGAFSFGNVTGGIPFSSSWWTNQFQVYNSAGTLIDGWQFQQGTNWTYTRQNAAAGIYIIKVEDGSGCIVSDTVEVKSRVGRNYYVSTAGSNANNGSAVAPFKSLKYAISQSCDRDTIVLLPGTHVEDSIVVNKPLYITSNLYLTGDTSIVSSTVIRGINNAVFYYSNVGSALITDTLYSGINGLTIEGGRTTGGERGGGFDVRESTLKISNCAVQGNTGHFGGGITLQSWNTRVVIANTVVRDNIATSQAGGVNVREIRSLTLRNVRVLNNQSNGDNGGIWLRYIQNLTIDGLVVKNNYSVGSYPVGEWRINGWGTYRNMYIADNVGGSGSNHTMRVNKEGWNDPTNGQEITFVNFLLVRNVTQNWPSLFLDGNTQLRLINSVVSDNSGRSSGYQNEGNIAFNDNAHLRLFNSIVTKNGAYAIVGNGCGTSFVTAKNSLIEGGQAAISNPSCGSQGAITTNLISPNLTTAPFFVDRTNGDYRLAKFSSMIGYGLGSAIVGTGVTLSAPNVDILGAVRPQPVNTNPDLGVYEHPNGAGEPGLNLIVTNNGSCQTANGAATVNLIRINNQPTGTPVISWIKLGDPTWTSQSTNTISNLASGSYQVTVTVGTSNTFIDTAVITTASALSIVNNSVLANCFGGNDGTLKFSIQGGSPFTGGTYKYNIQQLVRDGGTASWSDNSTQERSANFMAPQRSSGTYRVSITDAKGCQLVDTITLGYRNALPTAQITASGPLTICNGETVTLNASTTNPTNTYTWNDGSNLAVNTVSTSGRWIVTITDTSGCDNKDTVDVVVIASPVVTTGGLTAQLKQGLVRWYSFSGGVNGLDDVGTSSSPASAYGNAKMATDRFGNANSAIELDGNGDYLHAAANGLPTGERTVSLWFYGTDIGVGNSGRSVLGYGGQFCGQSWNMVIDNPGSPNGQNTLEVQGHCNSNLVNYSYGTIHPNNSWNHWVITTSASGTKMYLNGSLVQTSPVFISNTYVSGKDLIIGGIPGTNGIGNYVDGNATNFKGYIDDVGIWNRALSTSEVLAISSGSVLQGSASFCDSVTLSAPPGFDSYVWKNTANNNAVVGTSRSLKVTTSMAVKVEGTLNKSNNSACTLESQTHTITINATPKVTHFTSNVRTAPSDTITISAGISSQNATIQWFGNSSTTNQLITSTKGWKTIQLSENNCLSKDSVNYQWYCDTAKFMAMGSIYLRDSIGTKLDSAFMGSLLPPNYGVPVLKVTNPGSYIITSTYVYNSAAQGNGKYIIRIKPSPVLSILNLSNKIDIDSTAIKLLASRSPLSSVNWYRGSLLLGSSDTISVNSQGVVRAVVTKNGCSRSDSLMIYKPFYVAANGSNSNPGTLNQPFKTIQHGINQSVAGGKVYVLPGVYQERLEINKNVQLLSDFVRLNNQGAIASTIVDAQHLGRLIKLEGFTPIAGQMRIEGFTFRKGFGDNSTSGAGIYVNTNSSSSLNQAYVEISNSKFTDIYRVCCSDGIALFTGWNGTQRIRFKGVEFSQIGGLQNGDQRRAFAINSNSFVEFIDSKISQVYSDNGVFSINGGNLMLYNSHVSNSNTRTNSDGIFRIEGSNPKLELLHTTVNNVMFDNQGTDRFIVYNAGGNNSIVSIRNSVLSQVNDRIFKDGSPSSVYTIEGSVVSSTNNLNYSLPVSSVSAPAQTLPNGQLMSSSPAIGRGVSQWYSLYPRLIFSQDLNKQNRPIPSGSNPDAGAFENPMAVGEFDVDINTCGYSSVLKVLNSNSYSVTWSGPNGFASTSSSPVFPSKGSYQVSVVSFDRQDTLVRTVMITNPLEFTVTRAKDVCEGISLSSGAIAFGNVKGGIPNQGTWWTHRFILRKVPGQVIDGWDFQGSNWSYSRNNLTQGTYVIEVTDGAGCTVRDTVIINGQPSETYFVSTSGSDSAIGTSSQPLKTISEALTRACDGDTIILEDGRHFENVIINSESPKLTIGSRYLLDGDTNHIRNAIVDGMDLNPVFSINTNNQWVTDTVRLNGFTVTNGLANSGWNGGGGISIRWSNTSLANMRVVENRSGQNGGGIGVWESQIKMKNVLIKDNFATSQGGGLHLQYINNDLIQSNVRIVGNRASQGGGLFYSRDLGQQGQLYELDGFQIINNYATGTGGGAYINCWSGSADLQLSNSKIIGNVAGNDAGAVYVQTTNADVNFVNLIIARNEANHAGAIKVNNSKLNLIHSTLYQNRHKLGSTSAVTNLAIQVENQSTLKMYNSILGGQGAGGKTVNITDNSSSFEVVSGQLGGGASTVQAVSGSTVTILATSPNYTDQLIFLKDPSGGDYGLTSVSKALGRGLSVFPTGIVMPQTDIYGNSRPNAVNSNPDLGAIESNETAPTFGVAFVVSDNNACNTSIGQITAHPQNGSGSYTYSWTALTSGGIITNPTGAGASHTIANLFSGLYRVVVTDIGVTPNQVDTAIAEVRGDAAMTINKIVKNEGCQGAGDGSFEISVTGGSGFYTYTWLKPNGNTANTKNLLNLTPGIYSVTVTDNKGCSVSKTDTVGTSFAKPIVNITSQIVKAGGTTVTGGNDVRMCIGDQVVFNAGTGYDYYEWNKADGLNAEYTQTVSTLVSQTYSVYVEDTNGCSTTATAKVFVVYQPNVYASNVNRTMGQQFQQVTSYVRGDTSAVSGTVNSNLSPYNAQMGGGQKRMQFVISASELQGAGLTENTTINSLAFDVVNPNGVAVQAYKIKLAHTPSQQLGMWQAPLNQTETFAIPVYSPVQGWNTHNFSNSFAWNGVDNLLVEVCYLPVAGSMNSASVRVNQVNTLNTLTNFSYFANSCSGSVNQMGSANWRPTVRFGIDKVEVLDTVRVCDFTTLNTTDDYDTYTWYVNGVANTTAGLAINLTSPANVYLAATDAASSCVMRSDTFYVALDATPSVIATSSATGAVCAGDTVNLGTTSLGLASYFWSNGDSTSSTSVFESGNYVLQARSANGCVGSDTVSVSVKIPPTVVVKLNGKTLTATDGSLATKASSCVQSVLLPVNENFEDSLYVWTQSTADQLNWTFNSGVTNTQFSGPNGDFTTSDSSGNYYYLDRAGANSDDNKEAHLLSPCIQLVGAKKPYVAFAYHMYNGLYNAANPSSDNMGTLRIEVQTTEDAANYWLPLWSKTGHQGAGWRTDTLNLTAFAGKTIRFRVVGKAGVGGPRSEMAIDGFSIVDTANAYANTAGRISADIICEGDMLVAQTISNGSNQFSYVWSNGDTTSSIKVDTTGYYSVTVSDENGCAISTDSVWINVNPIPNRQLTVTGDLNNCYNESVAVTVQAAATYDAYTWFGDTALTPNNATTTLVSVQGVGIGQYRLGVRIVDSIGCAAISDTLKINRFVQPSITSTVIPVACYGDSTGSISVTPATGMYTYDWNTGDSTSVASGLWAGNYSVIFTDVHGCSDTSSITVGQPNPLSVSFVNANTQPVSCFGGANGAIWPTVVGGNGAYQYSWSGPNGFVSTASNVSNRVAGAYVLSVVDMKGCAIQDTHFVSQPALLDATLDSAVNVKCFQTPTGWIAVDVAGGNGGNVMNWKNATGQVIATGDSIFGLLAGSYRFVVTDVKGCKDSLTHVITQPQLLDLTTSKTQFAGGVNIRCFGDNSGAISTSTVGGTLPYQWLWSNATTTSGIDSLVSGTYSVTVTDAKGCKDSAVVVLTQPSALMVNATATDVLCNNDQTGSVVVSTSGSISPYWLDWSTTGVDSSMSRITLSLDLRGAANIVTPTVAVVGVPTNIPMTSYNGDSIYYVTIERKPGTPIYYRFYNGSTPELVPVSCGVNPPGLTDLHRVYTSGLNDTTLNAVCFASCVNCFGLQAGARSKALISTNVSISNQGSGIVSWSVVDANGCLVSGQDTINQPLPIAIQLDTVIDVSCPQAGDGSILITVSGGKTPYDFDWSNGDTIEDVLNENEGTYQLMLTDYNGCVDSAQFVLGAPQPFNFEEICMMTVDSLTGKNQVVWNKTPGKRTMEYQIFKETNVAGQYNQIGTVPYLSMSVFTDVNSTPQQQPDRYKIAVVDSCGNVSDTSDLHRTIHLQSSFGSGGEVNLAWTAYEGRSVQTYDIYRWVSTGNLVQIGSVSGATNTFSDLNPPVAPNVYYNVRAIFSGDACSPAAGKTSSYDAARSNILDQTGIGMPDMPWKGMVSIYPNPTNGLVTIVAPEVGFTYKVTNLLGQIVALKKVMDQEVTLDLSLMSAGMYQIELYVDGQIMAIDKINVLH